MIKDAEELFYITPFNGEGILENMEKKLKFEGKWKRNLFDGKGTLINKEL